MQYLLLIYSAESDMQTKSPEELGAFNAEYGTFTQSIIQSGHYKGGEALDPVSTAKSVRVRGGEMVVTDGPFAETREQLGGFYLVEAKDIDEAAAIAARIPSAREGTIEVRPIMVWGDAAPSDG